MNRPTDDKKSEDDTNMVLGRIIEIADKLDARVVDATQRLYMGSQPEKPEFALGKIMSELDRLDLLRQKVAWYEARFIVEGWDITIAEARQLLVGLRCRRELFSTIVRKFDGAEGPDFQEGLEEDACRVSLAALEAEIAELLESIEVTQWAAEVVDSEVDEVLGLDVEVRPSTRVPVATVPTAEGITKEAPRPAPSQPRRPAPPEEPEGESITDTRCSICMSEHRRAIERFAETVSGDVMATLDFASRNCDDPGLTPKDVVMHLDDHAPRSVQDARRGPG